MPWLLKKEKKIKVSPIIHLLITQQLQEQWMAIGRVNFESGYHCGQCVYAFMSVIHSFTNEVESVNLNQTLDIEKPA